MDLIAREEAATGELDLDRAELITAAPECKLSIGDHDAPALAVCLALLKAKAAQS